MNTQELLSQLDKNIDYINGFFDPGIKNKLQRFISHPGVVFSRLLHLRYKTLRNKFFTVKTKTFFGSPFYTHSYEYNLRLVGCLVGPEVKLQKYVIKNLQPHAVFMDIGAHHGYYAVLASYLMKAEGGRGEVHAFEPTDVHFDVLKANTHTLANVHINKHAICSTKGTRVFYENYGSGSTIDKNFYQKISKVSLDDFHTVNVSCITLDEYCESNAVIPTFLKIDVEGSEYEVLLGSQKVLSNPEVIIAMEAWSKPYDNTNHCKAIKVLEELHFKAHTIDNEGTLVPITYSDLLASLDVPGGTDNFVFKK